MGWVVLAPRNAAIAILRAYQLVVSPLYGDVCRYYPSCSHYTLQAIARYGVLGGVGLGAWRILRCQPWVRGGVDDVPARKREWAHQVRGGFVAPGVK
ncbi:MAG TPA: membrane protein insertion efficiency factor YidD [Microbacteriaceae bacterium]|nr:membrane protein insertion efficiency factor YidD [Microbacteriaceae bacterium]